MESYLAKPSVRLRQRIWECQKDYDQQYGEKALVQDAAVLAETYALSGSSSEGSFMGTRDLKGGATEVLLRYDEGLIEGTVSGVAGFLIFIAVAFVAGFFFGKELQLRKSKRKK